MTRKVLTTLVLLGAACVLHSGEIRDDAIGATYEYADSAKVVTFRVVLDVTGFELTGRVDYSRDPRLGMSLHSNQPLTVEDSGRLARIVRKEYRGDDDKAARVFTGALTWAGMSEPGKVIDLEEPGVSYHSICDWIGYQRRVVYDDDQGNGYLNIVTIGPCGEGYGGAGSECMGRCGPGCEADGYSPEYVQRFTDECAEHDQCARVLGQIWGPCADEWRAAAPGFVAAPDCNNLSGQFVTYTGTSAIYHLTERGSPIGVTKITGTFKDRGYYNCGVYKVDGARLGWNASLTMTQANPPNSCCKEFTQVLDGGVSAQNGLHCNVAYGEYSGCFGPTLVMHRKWGDGGDDVR